MIFLDLVAFSAQLFILNLALLFHNCDFGLHYLHFFFLWKKGSCVQDREPQAKVKGKKDHVGSDFFSVRC